MREEVFENGSEKQESHVVELGIRYPDGNKGFMITFRCSTQKECAAYNYVVSAVMRREKLNPFHQLGTEFNGTDQPGLHWWEALFISEVTRERFEALIPEIKERIEKRLRGESGWFVDLSESFKASAIEPRSVSGKTKERKTKKRK